VEDFTGKTRLKSWGTMSSDPNSDTAAGKPSVNADRVSSSLQVIAQGLLSGYPGAALLVRPNGTVIATNPKGASIEALLNHGALPEVLILIEKAVAEATIAAGAVTLENARGEVVLDVTVVPWPVTQGGGGLMVLARDLTMERNLRSALVESRQRYKDLVEVSSDFAWEVGQDGIFAFVSPKGALGYKAEELVGHRPEEFVLDPGGYDPLPFISDVRLDDVEMWMRQVEGETACVTTSCVPLLAENGEWKGARGVCKDVTQEREAEAALARARHREQLLNYIIGTIRDEVEPQNMLTAAAAAAGRALGATGCRIYRQPQPGVFALAAEHGATGATPNLKNILAGLEEESEASTVEMGNWAILAAATRHRQNANGAICMWKEGEEYAWSDDDRILIGDVANQLGIANEQITNHDRIVTMSRTDAMTGMLNRRAFFEEELPRRMARLERSGLGAALFYVDMDNFKRVNDVHGHQAGDDAIILLRDILIEYSRPGDVMARLGGDEFAMWMDGIPPDVVMTRAETLIEKSQAMAEFSGDEDHPLGISVGIATYDPAAGESLDDIVARSDAAMYAVKKAGKGGFELAPPPGTPIETDDTGADAGEENS
jgi:diguanylate cyclase (GGDEF)-like protein/PAS domain S-box-containing protein